MLPLLLVFACDGSKPPPRIADTGNTDTAPSPDSDPTDSDPTDSDPTDSDPTDSAPDSGAPDTAPPPPPSDFCSAADAPAPGEYKLDTPTSWEGAVATGARDPALGDLDGDGQVDVVIPTDTEVAVLLGSPGPAFTTGTAVAGAAEAVALGDLDGDGTLDLVSADGAVAFHRGVGDGTFDPAVTADPGCAPVDLAVGDPDGDGDLDVWAACPTAWALGTNDGAGGLSWSATATTHDIDEILVADFDGDGLDDAAFGGAVHRKVTMVAGGAVREIGIPTSMDAVDCVAVGDFDGDGDPDIAAGEEEDNEQGWLENDGTGRFTWEELTTVACEYGECGHASRMVALETGRADALLGWGDQDAWLRLGTADGPDDFEGGSAWGQDLSGWAFTDIDGDGRVDGVGVSEDGTVTVRLQVALGEFPHGSTVDLGPDLLTFTFADIDGDGADDLLTAETNTYRVFLADDWTEATSWPTGDATVESLAAADVDLDGDLDVLAAAHDEHELRILSLEAGLFVGETAVSLAHAPLEIHPADLDGDGDQDLVMLEQPTIEILLADGGTYVPATSLGDASSGYLYLVVADLDGDGALDIAVSAGNNHTFALYAGDGAGGFTDEGTAGTSSGTLSGLSAGDVDGDGDGDVDLVLTDDSSAGVGVLENQGGWAFSQRTTTVGTWESRATAVDLDEDGAAEVIVQISERDAGIYVWDGADLVESQAVALGSDAGLQPALPFVTADDTVGFALDAQLRAVDLYRTCR